MRPRPAPSVVLTGLLFLAPAISAFAQQHSPAEATETEAAMGGSLMELQPAGEPEAMPGTHSIF